jgi:predicted aminopeptidase
MRLKLFLSLLISIPLIGCSHILYFSKLGWHQSYIHFHSIPIQEVLEDNQIDKELKEKIIFVQEVKQFGERRLGLKETKSFSTFFETKDVLYVITASEKDRLELKSWKFPIVGKVTYKSFFKLKDVLKEREKLENKGFDTFIQKVSTYSTLGWFRDPIFSTLLKLHEPLLANIILHEMAHSTIYFKGETEFNEQMATFIGNQGSIEFLKERYGSDSEIISIAREYQEDDLIFAKWIHQVHNTLLDFYSQPVSREEKLRGREKIFLQIKEKFSNLKVQLKTECYKNFDQLEINNAVILAYQRYINNLGLFEALYESLGRDMKCFIQFLKEVKSSQERPISYIVRWLKERGFSLPEIR